MTKSFRGTVCSRRGVGLCLPKNRTSAAGLCGDLTGVCSFCLGYSRVRRTGIRDNRLGGPGFEGGGTSTLGALHLGLIGNNNSTCGGKSCTSTLGCFKLFISMMGRPVFTSSSRLGTSALGTLCTYCTALTTGVLGSGRTIVGCNGVNGGRGRRNCETLVYLTRACNRGRNNSSTG